MKKYCPHCGRQTEHGTGGCLEHNMETDITPTTLRAWWKNMCKEADRMTFDEWWTGRNADITHKMVAFQAWNAAVDETKKECARAIRKQCGREWIEAHYDLIEETIMEVEV